MTKRISEIYCENMDRSAAATRFVTVRFGNVMGSRGSVLPLFHEQLRDGGPITVTHPEITRYFMTIREACQLIMQASVMGGGGEIFVLNMGSPVKIAFLAEQLIRLSGRRPGRDIEIRYTGLRPGEKLSEELFHRLESREATSHEKILLATHRPVDRVRFERALATVLDGLAEGDEALLKKRLRETLELIDGPERQGGRVIPLAGGA